MSIRRDPRMLNAQGEPAFVVDYRDEYGRRKQKRTDACTLKDAQRVERAILTEIDTAKALGISRPALDGTTFGHFAETVFLPEIKKTIRKSTQDRYEDLYEHVKGFFGGMKLAAIDTEAVLSYFTRAKDEKTRLGGPPGREELNHRRNLIGAILQAAKERKLVAENPARELKLKKSKEEEKNRRAKRLVLSQDDERKVLEAAPAWLRPFITVGIYAGMREGEIAAMTWENVDREEGFIYIPDSKTGEPRHVPINPAVDAILASQTRAIVDGRALPWVFYNARRLKPYSSQAISTAFSRVADSLGIPATFHCTRHTFITRARHAGVKDVDVQAITGHKTSRMLAHYTHVQPEHLAGATDILCRKDAEPVQNEAAEG